ncbi:hypothetical protein [Sporosarcina cyprini]|uniref:hypothetical protein n=1 Tax=Sporosarcina cyprini TaxID=2910523 RepID=UPI001EE147B5|nr:hypothetical protein [Sporosarcina cyprini]MCG3088489.1 hypothetical protein [Sporosarcina cyprini]
MFKKVIPVLFVSGVVLAGCGTNNNTVPNKNETPMEALENRDLTPRVYDGQTGPNMDGINTGQERYNNNNPNGGILNDTNRNGLDGRVNDRHLDMNGTTAPTEEIIIEENTTTPSRNNGTMNRNGNNNR